MKTKITSILLMLFLISFNASAGNSSSPPATSAAKATIVSTPNKVLSDGAELFENFSESAAIIRQAEFTQTMGRYQKQEPGINAVLTPAQRSQLVALIAGIKKSWSVQNRTDISLYAIEAYRVLESAMKRNGSDLPLGISLLDYSGFKLAALASNPKPDWKSIAVAVKEANQWWSALSPRVQDDNLKQAMSQTVKAYEQGLSGKNPALLAYAASMNLILVDALEIDIVGRSKK